MKLVLGSDTGQIRFFIGWYPQMLFESWVAMGFTPMEAIVFATRDGAAIAKMNTGLVAAGRNADFVVLDANPLENIANSRRINKVFLRGQGSGSRPAARQVAGGVERQDAIRQEADERGEPAMVNVRSTDLPASVLVRGRDGGPQPLLCGPTWRRLVRRTPASTAW